MPSFHEVLFPPSISMGATGGPGFSTSVLALASGFESRNINWSVARATYDVAHGLKNQDQLNELIDFFYARKGRAYGFRFLDFSDRDLPSPGMPDQVQQITTGTPTAFQVSKLYGDAGNSYTRALRKIAPGTTTVYDNGAITTDLSLDENTGIILPGPTLGGTTGHAITVTCQFHVPVRFDVDQLKMQITDYEIYSWGQIPLIEVRV